MRYFEKPDGHLTRFWTIGREGIRCTTSWGLVGGKGQGMTTTLDDEAHAEQHLIRKIGEKCRRGYVEVTRPQVQIGPDDAPADEHEDIPLLELMQREAATKYAGAWEFFWSGYEPVDGYAGVHAKFHDFRDGPGPFHDYLVLCSNERRGLTFVVKDPGHDRRTVSEFLDFVCPRWELAFDGRSHHKLPARVGRFDHVLFCAPSLSGARYGGRMATVMPIFDCEIADEDTETLVEARLRGRESMPSTTWDRAPHPVTDLRFDLRLDGGFPGTYGRTSWQARKFKVFPRSTLEQTRQLLTHARPDSRLEIRNYRQQILTLTPADTTSLADIDRFLLGTATA